MNTDRESGDAVARLAAADGQKLVTFAFLLCGDSDEAQDIVQSVLVRLLGSGPFLSVEDPLAYARRAVSNEFIDRRRHLRRRFRAFVLMRGERPRGSDGMSQTDDRQALSRAFSKLSSRERAAVVLRYYEDWTDDEIARVIGSAPATVRSLLSRAMPKLRSALADPFYEQGE